MDFKNIMVLLITLVGFTIMALAQKAVVSDTIYYRYDNSVGEFDRSNYYSVKLKETGGVVAVKEYYRFTIPHSLKATYTEDLAGKKQGPYILYNKDGFIEEEGVYVDGEREGTIIFYKKGALQRKVPHTKGKRNGVATYYNKGEKLYDWTWKNGDSEGYNESTFDDGTVRFKGTYLNGKREGISLNYQKGGALRSSYVYKNGKTNGASKVFHDNGALYSEGNYLGGEKSGEWKWYREDGTLASTELYSKSGRLKKLAFFDAQGNEIKSRKKDQLKGVIDDKKELHKRIQKHVLKNYKYPEVMRNAGFEARVYVTFEIDKNGDVVDLKSTSDSHPSFDLEAMNMLRTLPKQTPAVAHNVPISVSFRIPIAFKIED